MCGCQHNNNQYQQGGAIDSARRFSESDFNKLIYTNSFDKNWTGFVWEIYSKDSSRVLGKFNPKSKTLFIVGNKDLSNDLVKYLHENSYVSKNEHEILGEGGSVLSNSEIITDINFSDNTDIRHGRYDFYFTTKDSEGAEMYDYDGYIIESPKLSRRDDEVEWGQNVPEDWEKAEEILINAFYEWKRGKYKNGGGIREEGIDLFEDYENIPENVQEILDEHQNDFEDGDYQGLEQALKELEQIGYTFDYYVDGQAYDLRPIGTKGKSELSSEFKNGGSVDDYFWNYAYRFYMRDASLAKRKKVKAEFIKKGLELDGKSPEHAYIVVSIVKPEELKYFNKIGDNAIEYASGGGVSMPYGFASEGVSADRFKDRQKAFVGYLGNTISIEVAQTFLGRKINSWEDDVILIGDTMYKKVYLKPEYKKI